MPDLNPVQLNSQFTDVRKAYRLLYNFQKRILDILKLVEDELLVEYYGGYAKFSNQTPAASFGSLEDSAWDWLNFYVHEFHFREEELRYRYHINMSIFLVSDTGYFDAVNAVKDNPRTFIPVELAHTKLVFMIGKDAWYDDFDDFEINFKSDAPNYVRSSRKGVVLAKSFDLDAFNSHTTAMQSLQSLLHFWQKHGIYEMSLKHH